MFRCAIVCVVVLTSLAYASPAKKTFWNGTPIDGMVEEMRSLCAEDNDSFSCMKYKVMNFLDTILQKDNYKVSLKLRLLLIFIENIKFQLSDDVEVRSNGFIPSPYEQRSEKDVFEKVSDYVQSHDVTVNLPVADAKVTISPKALSEGEFNVNVKFAEANARSVEARGKSKLKKIMIPILVFVLLKAMTLVPLALGVLGLKAWNALQLSFFSFIISFALAVFQLCKKVSATHNTFTHT
jgi:hypothetical protein